MAMDKKEPHMTCPTRTGETINKWYEAARSSESKGSEKITPKEIEGLSQILPANEIPEEIGQCVDKYNGQDSYYTTDSPVAHRISHRLLVGLALNRKKAHAPEISIPAEVVDKMTLTHTDDAGPHIISAPRRAAFELTGDDHKIKITYKSSYANSGLRLGGSPQIIVAAYEKGSYRRLSPQTQRALAEKIAVYAKENGLIEGVPTVSHDEGSLDETWEWQEINKMWRQGGTPTFVSEREHANHFYEKALERLAARPEDTYNSNEAIKWGKKAGLTEAQIRDQIGKRRQNTLTQNAQQRFLQLEGDLESMRSPQKISTALQEMKDLQKRYPDQSFSTRKPPDVQSACKSAFDRQITGEYLAIKDLNALHDLGRGANMDRKVLASQIGEKAGKLFLDAIGSNAHKTFTEEQFGALVSLAKHMDNKEAITRSGLETGVISALDKEIADLERTGFEWDRKTIAFYHKMRQWFQ